MQGKRRRKGSLKVAALHITVICSGSAWVQKRRGRKSRREEEKKERRFEKSLLFFSRSELFRGSHLQTKHSSAFLEIRAWQSRSTSRGKIRTREDLATTLVKAS